MLQFTPRHVSHQIPPQREPKLQPNNTEMTTSAPTIIDLKTSFLRSQIILLSQPLQPSPNFYTQISAEENALRQKNIDEALYKLNGLLKKHNKVSYGPQALRHVAEQVDRLYWNTGERGVKVPGEEWAERGADLREFSS